MSKKKKKDKLYELKQIATIDTLENDETFLKS